MNQSGKLWFSYDKIFDEIQWTCQIYNAVKFMTVNMFLIYFSYYTVY